MKFQYIATRLLALSLILILPSIGTAAADSDIYVVAMDPSGNSNYMESYGDGTFSEQEFLGAPVDENGNPVDGFSMANGIGDFDGDGDLDYLVAKGVMTGFVYFFEKLGPGRNFKAPVEVAAWVGNDGLWPIGMAVADFNGDDILDFLLTYYQSSHGELFLGKKEPAEEEEDKPAFTSFPLADIAPAESNDADAADFNNDGNADFVVAPFYGGKFVINIGQGDGTFLTPPPQQLTSYSEGNYWNVALADFDNDGNVDLIASNNDYIDFYQGQGEVTEDEPQFIWRYRIPDNNMLDSAIDNFDFDNDGNQDLIVGKYGDDLSVAVLLGQGDGKTFIFDPESGIYGGGEGDTRFTIAAPSIIGAKNIPPVAAIDYDVPTIVAGRPITFDGSGSIDNDGEIVSYIWNFGDDDYAPKENFAKNTAGASAIKGVSAQHVFYEAGEHTVTLTVIDDQGATHSVQIQIKIAPLPVRVKFNPRTLKLNSKGKWIKATIILPKKQKACGVDLTGMFTATDDAFMGYADPDYGYGFLSNFIRKRNKCRRILRVRFDRQEIINGLMDQSGKVRLRVDGRIMVDGQQTDFSGYGAIRVIQPRPEKKSKWLPLNKKSKSYRTCKKN